ncbi:hypothetical protein [Rhodanobacter sp. MP7CTX1]|uniref:hypothetical protein n=1 Tax=Rhodanobacter sp. MP7CTX1 TaxID=2723084 RepID=UPI00160D8CC4|nr:hypothetical protein [Rhodanobacter sp. MP7CTX1]MBB6187990.1 hypothetical protein [Rhodanobacter sp. MP7CTX1]
MDTIYDVGHIESGVPLPQRTGAALTPGQQRVLELNDGDSFVLHATRIADDNGVILRGRFNHVSDIAARLSSWARGRRVRLAYRVIDKDTARIWRLGAI